MQPILLMKQSKLLLLQPAWPAHHATYPAHPTAYSARPIASPPAELSPILLNKKSKLLLLQPVLLIMRPILLNQLQHILLVP
jgi:hypothetical protein